jgi:cell fate (sporulation/competence/biofilm development) regulator YlbF (YheA/YmcA/DUF963 family)
MENEIKYLAFSLKEKIETDSRILSLLESERIVNEDLAIKELSIQLGKVELEYNEALKHSIPESELLKSIQKRLFQAKQKLDSHPLVIQYQKNYQAVRLLYGLINQQLFNVFNQHVCEVHR